MKNLSFIAAAAFAGLTAHAAHANGLNIGEPIEACVSADVTTAVAAYYKGHPGVTLNSAAQDLNIPELNVATAAPDSRRVAAKVTAEQVKDIWTSIDGWGAKTAVRLLFTMGGKQLMDFPSLVPTRQADLQDGWLDIYADDGAGVHGHLWLGRVDTVHAVDLAGSDGERTRAISFYAPEGHLIMGVYASIAGEDFDSKAVKGFERTRKAIAALPQLCS